MLAAILLAIPAASGSGRFYGPLTIAQVEIFALLGVVLLYVAIGVAASVGAGALLGPGLRQMAGAAVLRTLLLPLAMVALVLLYLRARAAVDGQPEAALRDQYIRRISAPG